jgi:hypothetical protein
MADQLGVSGLFVVGGALVSVPLLERRCRRQKELDEAVTAIAATRLAFKRDSLVGSNKGDKYGIETKEKRVYRARSDRSFGWRRENTGHRRELGA